MSSRSSNTEAFSFSFSDFVKLIERNEENEVRKLLNIPRKYKPELDISLFENEVISPLYTKNAANITKEKWEDNLFYCYDDFLTELNAARRKKGIQYAENEAKKDFSKAVDRFIKSIRKYTSWDVRSQNYQFSQIEKHIKRIRNGREILIRARNVGRPATPFNILIYHLVNKLSFWKRDKKRDLIYDKNGLIT